MTREIVLDWITVDYVHAPVREVATIENVSYGGDVGPVGVACTAEIGP